MKRRVLRILFRAALCLAFWMARVDSVAAANPVAETPPPPGPEASPAMVVDTPPPLGTETQTPPPASPSAAPDKAAKPGKKGKVPKVRTAKEFPFPLPIHEDANNAKIPELNELGNILSVINAGKMTRIDNEHVLMQQVKYDLNKPDGKQDFHITLPASVFDLKTHIITSNDPVTVQTDDFELTGERMEFDTVNRTGKLLGHVAMHIHNLKQVAAVPDATPVPP